MKKTFLISLGIIGGLLFSLGLTNVSAFSVFTTIQGGTGTSSPSGILYGDNGATNHLNTVIIGSNLTFSGGILSSTGGGSGTYPFTPTQNFGQLTQATSGIPFFQNGFFASSTATTSGDLIFTADSIPTERNIKVQDQYVTNANGNGLTIFSGNGNGSGTGGDLTLFAGDGDTNGDGNGGGLFAEAGRASSNGGTGGVLSLLAGQGFGAGNDGGAATVAGGPGNTIGKGGDITVEGGNGGTTGNGGLLNLDGGAGGFNGTSGNGGDINLEAGNGIGAGKNSGIVYILGGQGSSGASSGDIRIAPGAGSPDGKIKFFQNTNLTRAAIFDTSILASSDKTFQFPNWSGTFIVATGTAEAPAFVATSTATSFFSYASTTAITATIASTTNLVISGLAKPAGTILAVDPTGAVIATSTSAGGVTSVSATYPIISSGGATPNISTALSTSSVSVCASGCPFTSIQNARTAGFKNIQLAPETYTLTSPIVLSQNNITITGAGPNTIINCDTSTLGVCMYATTAISKITLRDFTINNTATAGTGTCFDFTQIGVAEFTDVGCSGNFQIGYIASTTNDTSYDIINRPLINIIGSGSYGIYFGAHAINNTINNPRINPGGSDQATGLYLDGHNTSCVHCETEKYAGVGLEVGSDAHNMDLNVYQELNKINIQVDKDAYAINITGFSGDASTTGQNLVDLGAHGLQVAAAISYKPTYYWNNINIGVGTSTPTAMFAIHDWLGSSSTMPFLIASSTNGATTTLLSIDNTGLINISGTIQSTASAASTFPYASTTALTSTNASTSNLVISSLGTGSNRFLKIDGAGVVGSVGFPLSEANGGTNASAAFPANTLIAQNSSGTTLTPTSSPTVNFIVATTSTASILPYASTTGLSVSNLTSGGCVQASTGGFLTTVGSGCNSGGGGTGVGTISTSSTENINEIPFFTTKSAYPAKVSGSLDLQWDNANKILSIATTSDQISSLDTGGTFNLNVGGDGEPLNMQTHDGITAGSTGGDINITGGNGSTTGRGGAVFISSGFGSLNAVNGTGTGGDIEITTGNGGAVSGDGGNILLATGPATSGNKGQIELATGNNGNYAILDTTNLSTSRTDKFPDWAGSLAVATGTLEAPAFNATSTATSTFAGGLNIAGTDCYAVQGTCLQTLVSSASAYKQAVKYASTSTLPSNTYNNGTSGVGATITGVALQPLFIDGNTAALGDRILVKNEATGANNGVYTVTTAGVAGVTAFVLTRATDYNTSNDVFPGVANFVNSGTVNANTCWILTNTSAVTIGTTALTYDDACGAGSYTGSSPIIINGTNITFVAPVSSALSIPFASTTAITATNASTTNLVISGLATGANRFLFINSSGAVSSVGFPLSQANGGTGASAAFPASMLIAQNGAGNTLVSTSTPTAASYDATSTIASIFPYASSTALTAGNLFAALNVGVGSTTPWGLLSVASSSFNYLQPLFAIATSSDQYGQLFNVSATSSVQTTISNTVMDALKDVGTRIGVGLSSYLGFGGLLDQFVVNGRINTQGWNYAGCDSPVSVTGTAGTNICNGWGYGENEPVAGMSVTIVSSPNASGYAPFYRFSGLATLNNAGALWVDSVSASTWLTAPTSTPVLEATMRFGNSVGTQMSTSTAYIGFLAVTGGAAQTNTPPTDGCYFTASSTIANWHAIGRNNNAETNIDTGVASTTNTAIGLAGFRRFRVEADNTHCAFYIQNTQPSNLVKVANITTNIPTTAGLNGGVDVTNPGAAINGPAPVADIMRLRMWWRDFIPAN